MNRFRFWDRAWWETGAADLEKARFETFAPHQRHDSCPTCKATCKATGKVPKPDGEKTEKVDCPDCQGSGKIQKAATT